MLLVVAICRALCHCTGTECRDDDFEKCSTTQCLGSSSLLGSNAGAKRTANPTIKAMPVEISAVSVDGTQQRYCEFCVQTCSTCSLLWPQFSSLSTLVQASMLTPVPSTPNSDHTFAAVRGTTYFIAVIARQQAAHTSFLWSRRHLSVMMRSQMRC